ncbi:hypothetical protein [Pseudomonas typographi]|uniref:hypothetical protein n=1 Tax=Pseudomonas typographi TaxID=2715964 RepID=UPI001689DA51|nr:hypothetical protein [Pseudomonas typographi]MBD1587723.1 hypothetical protein [Pseudomonas typographi]
MAAPYLTDYSFVARLSATNTQYPGPVGTWEYSPGMHNSKLWHAGSWLTTTRRDSTPQALWFGAVEYGDEGDVFEIRLWAGQPGSPLYNRRIDKSKNGYLGVYGLGPAVGPLWRLSQEGGQLRIATLEGQPVGVAWDHAVWTSGRRGSYLCIAEGGGARFDIEIVQGAVAEPL